MFGMGKSGELGCGERMVESKSPYLLTSLLRFVLMRQFVVGKILLWL